MEEREQVETMTARREGEAIGSSWCGKGTSREVHKVCMDDLAPTWTRSLRRTPRRGAARAAKSPRRVSAFFRRDFPANICFPRQKDRVHELNNTPDTLHTQLQPLGKRGHHAHIPRLASLRPRFPTAPACTAAPANVRERVSAGPHPPRVATAETSGAADSCPPVSPPRLVARRNTRWTVHPRRQGRVGAEEVCRRGGCRAEEEQDERRAVQDGGCRVAGCRRDRQAQAGSRSARSEPGCRCPATTLRLVEQALEPDAFPLAANFVVLCCSRSSTIARHLLPPLPFWVGLGNIVCEYDDDQPATTDAPQPSSVVHCLVPSPRLVLTRPHLAAASVASSLCHHALPAQHLASRFPHARGVCCSRAAQARAEAPHARSEATGRRFARCRRCSRSVKRAERSGEE